jgi:pyrroline-5-carboxylate reductase
MAEPAHIVLVGAGNMGQALLGGWLARDRDPGSIAVIEKAPAALDAARSRGVRAGERWPIAGISWRPEVLLLAVKPVQLAEALAACRDLVAPGVTLLSIVAGKRFASYRQVLGRDAALVRAMPNTPAAIGRGMTVLCASPPVGEAEREFCAELMKGVGAVAWVEHEEDLDAVTAVSGSGPAYLFLLIEALTAAALDLGLDEALAREIAMTTVAGAGAYALESGVDAGELRRRVTSPGGTTEAALSVLMAPGQGLPALLLRAVRAAQARSRELA